MINNYGNEVLEPDMTNEIPNSTPSPIVITPNDTSQDTCNITRIRHLSRIIRLVQRLNQYFFVRRRNRVNVI